MPIYFVIEEWVPNPMQMGVYKIIKVIECDYSDVNTIYNREVQPLTFGLGRNISTRYYYREPANPFREAVTEQTTVIAER